MVSIKYMFIVLAADDDGEGGTFVLYSLLAWYAHIVRRDPNTSRTVKMDRHLTGELKPVNKGVRNFIENSARVTLKILGVVGVSIVMASVSNLSIGILKLMVLAMVFLPQPSRCLELFKVSGSQTPTSQLFRSNVSG